MKLHKLLAGASLALAALGAQASLITNGTFEAYTGTAFTNGFQTVNTGSTALVGWTVSGVSVDIIEGAYGAVTGYSIDMLGTPGPGAISQSFATVVGQSYTLSFDLSANNGGSNNNALYVDLTGSSQAAFAGATPFTTKTLNFVATGAQTTLTFTSGASGYSGAVIDNVSVSAVPEPETYAMLLAGLGLMGAIARRRKQA